MLSHSDRGARACGEVSDEQRHVGVRGARRRVTDLGGLPVRIGRVGDVPAPDVRLVYPRDEQPGAVGRPPVAAEAAHFLARDELREAVRDAVFPRDDRVVAGFEVGDPQPARVHVADLAPRRVRPRVERRGVRGHQPRLAGGVAERGRVHLPGQREDREGVPLVGRVGHDARAGLPDPLPPRALLRRQVLVVGAERLRVGYQAFRAGARGGLPQAAHRVVAALGPQERDPLAVGGYPQRAGRPDREPPRPRLLPGKTVRHASRSCQALYRRRGPHRR